jgi:hypothetical protein
VNVIIKVNGREAIPVRALPLLSDYKTMSPDVVAKAFAGKNERGGFVGLCAYRMECGVVVPIAKRWWQTGPCQKLDALSATIHAEERPAENETENEYKNRHARELAKWRDKSLDLLPAGVFVFKDEYEGIYSNEFKYGSYYFRGDDRKPLSELEHSERIALDYSPFIEDTIATSIFAGFERDISPDAVIANADKQHSREANTVQPLAHAPAAAALMVKPIVEDWKNTVRAEAYEQWVRVLASNGTPTLDNVSTYLAHWCVANGVNGSLGKPPKSGYIKVHVIGGTHWTPPRGMTREAAKKQLEQEKQAI